MADLSVVGKRLPKLDSLSKATGEAGYLDDLRLPGMAYGKVLRSPFPHARIKRIDTSRAKTLPGVLAVITSADTPGIKFSFKQDLADKLILNGDVVRYIGDEVAAVAAVNERIAEEAISLIEVEYEELPAVFDPEEAMALGAPQVHEGRSNITWEIHRAYGDVEAAFQRAEHLFENRFATSPVAHCCMEARGCIAHFDTSGRLTVWDPSQAPHTLRQEIARVLDLPLRKVKVARPWSGGSFGNRLVMDMKIPIAAILSRKCGRPVKIVNSRSEEFETARTRYPYIIYLKTGVMEGGLIIARQARVIVDNGAYNDKGPATLSFSGAMFCLQYNVPNLKYDAYVVYTNRQFGTGFRGFGNPQMTFAAESQIDMIAEKIGMDPMELRLRNVNRAGVKSATGVTLKNCAMEEAIRSAALRAGWKEKRGRRNGRGIGMAVMVHTGGGNRFYGYNSADAFIKIAEDGTISLFTSAVDLGQGAETAMAQIAAEELGVNLEDIVVITGDTDIMPFDLGAWGSRTTWVNGQAVKAAAADAKRQLLEAVAAKLEANPNDLVARDRRIFVAGNPEKGVEFKEAVRICVYEKGEPVAGKGRFHDTLAPLCKDWDIQSPNYTTGCHVAEVEVDRETGEVKVLNLVAANDVGRAINPISVEGQVEGGIGQGLGFALTEQLREERGKVLNPNFAEYKIPTFLDMPALEPILIESIDPDGPYGAMGIGEPALVPTAAAIANAVYDAVGVRIYELPITSEVVLAGLKALRAAG